MWPLPVRPHTKTDAALVLERFLLSHPWSLAESHHKHANWETASELCPGSARERQDACRRRCNEARGIHRALLLLDSSRLGSVHTLTHAWKTCLLQRAALNSDLRLRRAAVDMCGLHPYVPQEGESCGLRARFGRPISSGQEMRSFGGRLKVLVEG